MDADGDGGLNVASAGKAAEDDTGDKGSRILCGSGALPAVSVTCPLIDDFVEPYRDFFTLEP